MSPDEKPIPLWQKCAAVAYVIVAVVLVVVFRSHLHADFIPVDNSHIAPNILAEIVTLVVATPVGVLVWPPTRRRLHRFVDRKFDAIHQKVDALDTRHDQHAESVDALHKLVTELHEKIDGQTASKVPAKPARKP